MATITIRVKEFELDIDPAAGRIGRFALAYDLVVAGVATPQLLSVKPDVVQEFHLWAAMREVLRPLFDATGIAPPPPPQPERTQLPASPAFGMDSNVLLGPTEEPPPAEIAAD